MFFFSLSFLGLHFLMSDLVLQLSPISPPNFFHITNFPESVLRLFIDILMRFSCFVGYILS